MGACVGRESDDRTGGERSVEAGGSGSVAAGGDITNAITGGTFTAPVIQARTSGDTLTGSQYTGDHVDFRDATFNDRVTAAEHHYYAHIPAPADWRPVTDAEPLEFGVRLTQHVPGQPDVPPYVPRDCDEELRAKLAHRGLVLILGEPYTGKSYTAWHGVRGLAGHRLYAPDPGEDLRGLLAALKGEPGQYIVWLDELTDHLGEDGLDPRMLARLTGLGAVLLGTMSPDEYYRRRSGDTPGDRAIAMARTVDLPRRWSEAELERLAAHDDPRAYPAYMWSGEEGAASYFAVGHLLFDEWRREGTRTSHPRGQLLVRAAVDLARCGVTGAVPVELLRRVQEQYGDEERESFEDALAWATTSMFGVAGLLVAGEETDTWRAYGALVAEALRSEDLDTVPDGVWWLLLDATEDGAPIDRAAVLDAARAALHRRFEAGDAELMFAFADRVGGEEHETLLRGAADAGHARAAEDWAARLLDTGDEMTALRYLHAAAESGSVTAAREVGRLHRAHAERWLRVAAESGDGRAAHELGKLLVGSGGTIEALRWYVKAFDAGHEAVAASLGTLMMNWNRPQDAEFWLRRGAALGDPLAVFNLAILLDHWTNHDEEVEHLLRRLLAEGYSVAPQALGSFLHRSGSHEEAEAVLTQAALRGSGEAAFLLGAFFLQAGAGDEATVWFRRAAQQGHYDAKMQLGELPSPPSDPPATVDE